MLRSRRASRRSFHRSEKGAVSVEFALVLPLLIILILGGMDFGHMFYIQHVLTLASREGARYAARYTGATSEPTAAQIANYVKSSLDYDSILSDLTITASYSGTSPNRIVTVTAQAQKTWWILHLLPGFSSGKLLQATTAMTLEKI